MVSYDSPANVTNVSAWLDRPAGAHGFIRAEDGHLRNDAGPVRFWATNICFEGCFPTHQQAERLAARLARLGINCVRMHHMDSHSIWGNSPNKLTIDPRKLERLDYLIDQLRKHGVYTNLNLHVSRWFDEAEGFSGRAQRPDYDKGLDNFEPRMIELQKKYARDLLTHVNPYTGNPYTREPAIAFVEINNENALHATWGCGPDRHASRALCRHVPEALERLAQEEVRQHRAAQARPGTRKPCPSAASFCATASSGRPRRAPGTWSATTTPRPTGPSRPMVRKASPCLRIVVNRSGSVSWHPQFSQGGLAAPEETRPTR